MVVVTRLMVTVVRGRREVQVEISDRLISQ